MIQRMLSHLSLRTFRDALRATATMSKRRERPFDTLLRQRAEAVAAAATSATAAPHPSTSAATLPLPATVFGAASEGVSPPRKKRGQISLRYDGSDADAPHLLDPDPDSHAAASPAGGSARLAASLVSVSPGRREPTFERATSAASASALGASAVVPVSLNVTAASSATATTSSAFPAASASTTPLWQTHLSNITLMRARRDAPVDTMGCDRCADPSAPPAVQRFQILVSLMLSSQTKDEVVHAAMQRLVAHGCTPATIAATPLATLEALITPCGFFRNKARFVCEAAAAITADWKGDIPSTAEGLMSLKGVGPKMAHIAMLSAWGVQEGLGVDVHMHRIANRLGWVKTSSPEGTRASLEGWLPREHWSTLNTLLVGFGQQVCQEARPSCDVCLNRASCPYGRGRGRGAK